MLSILQEGQPTAAGNGGRHVLCKPSFLQTMLKEIVLAGKSMELLNSLGQRVDVLRGTSSLPAVLFKFILLMNSRV